MKGKRFFISAVFLLLLSSCGSVKSDMKSFLRCGIAANQLEQTAAKKAIEIKMSQYIEKYKVDGSARDVMFLGQEVRDEMSLYNKGLEAQIYTLVKVHNSSKCQKMHGQETISMPFKYYFLYFFI